MKQHKNNKGDIFKFELTDQIGHFGPNQRSLGQILPPATFKNLQTNPQKTTGSETFGSVMSEQDRDRTVTALIVIINS